MPPLTADRQVASIAGTRRTLLVAAGAVVFAGADIAIEGGFAKPAYEALNLSYGGTAVHPVDNSAGLDGDATVEVDIEIRAMLPSDPGELDSSSIEQIVYWVDDQTVSLDDNLGTRSVAGVVQDIHEGCLFVRPPMVA